LAQVRSSDVFPLPAGAEMIVAFFARSAIQSSEKITPADQPGYARFPVTGMP
jgi:hypothetical protein